MTKRRRRAVLYYRQSKAKDDSISIEIQDSSCRAYCASKGYDIAEVLVDEDVSGRIAWQKRPNFPRVFDIDADVVLVYRWSRLSRARRDQVNLIAMLDDAGKPVECATEQVDPSTAGGRLSRDTMLNVAAYESDLRSEQWKEAQARRIAHGLPSGGTPRFGYAKQGYAYVPDPQTGPVLRELYLRYTAGAGFQGLVKWLNDNDVPTTRGREWGTHSLIRALDSGFGAGLIITKRGQAFIRGAHEAVISDEEWDAYVRARDARRQLPAKRKNPKWFLSGLVKCGLCGAPMQVNSYTSAKSQVICTRYKNSRSCSGMWINRRMVEQRVAIWVGGHVEDVSSHLQEADTRSEVESTVQDLTDALMRTDDALGRLAKGWAMGTVDDAGYQVAQDELRTERDDIAKKLADAKDELARLTPLTQDEYSKLEHAGEGMEPGEWGQLLSRVIRRIEVHRDRVVIEPITGEATVTLR